MLSSDLLGVIFALNSALVWGSGDFSGGIATRRNNPFQVLALASITGIVVLALLAIVRGEGLPDLTSSAWATSAGVSGALGIAALYRALSLGNAAIVAPIAAVIGAILPILFGTAFEGVPRLTQIAGFLAGIVGIWLLTKSPSASRVEVQGGMLLAFSAGLGFGGFFILIAQVEPGIIFTPLLVAKSVSLGVALVILSIQHSGFPAARSNPVALIAGVLDAGGNVFYLLAEQFTRLDVAAVLSSMYPASTVILASLILKEKVSPVQWAGVFLCLFAVALIAV
ncbi:MAG: EamA family transporter [Proteobacteria bacterium]|nr:EamA family transporter [Pseudomonadota bacterium]NIS68087.1 EamA family transporter [Pseudomonadota bacterium]